MTGIEEAPARSNGRRGIAGVRGAAVLRLQQIAVAPAGNIEGVSAWADQAALFTKKRLSAFSNGTEQGHHGVSMMPVVRKILVVLVMLAAGAARGAIEPAGVQEGWTSLRVDELTLYSNATAEVTRDVAGALMRMRDAIGYVSKLNVRSPLPSRIFVFRDEASFAPYRNAFMGDRSSVVNGAFISTRDTSYVILNASSGQGIDRVVYHELTHAFLRNTISGLPLWFDEGIAEFYSTFALLPDLVKVGLPPAGHRELLRSKGLLPLRQLLTSGKSMVDDREETRTGLFYAESWMLVHYLLLDSPERRGQLGALLEELDQQVPIDAAFTHAFHTTYEELERELRRNLDRPSVKFVTYPVAALRVRSVSEPLPIRRDEALFALGDLLAHAGPRSAQNARALLTQAVRDNPRNAAAQAALASLLAQSGNVAEAESLFAAALRIDGSSARTYLLFGESILARLTQGEAPRQELQRARDLFTKAIALDSASPRAYAGLGATYTFRTEDAGKGVSALEKSLALAGDQDDVAFHLALVYSRLGQREDAEHLVRGVLARFADAETLLRARENLFLADLKVANDLMSAGQYERAIELWRSVAGATTREELRKQVAATIAEAESYRRRASQSARFNAAIGDARKGDYDSALAKVTALLPEITDPDLLGKVRTFRWQVAPLARGRRP